MTRKLIALLLCIAMIGSMTVYAVGDEPACTCGTETEEHTAECALYEAPAEPVDEEPAEEPAEEPVCTCGTETEEHTAECALYVAPAPVEPASNETDTQSSGPAVGDKIWINSGSNVYKNMNDKHSHSLWGNYEVKIDEIVYDDNGAPAWYRFSFTSFGFGEAFLHSYKYVKVENTSVTNPEDPRACTCGDQANVDLSKHADACPRKQYVKSLFEGKTAEEIYAQWENYDDGIRVDLLNMLQAYDNAKWLELKNLVDTQPDDDEDVIENPVCDQYKALAPSGVGAQISAPEGAFPEGTALSVTDTTVDLPALAASVSGTVKGAVAVDISFGGEQPSVPVLVRMVVPEEKIPAGANQVQIFHMTDAGPELCGTQYLSTTPGETITFTTGGFSTYVAVFVNGKYDAKLMRDELAGNSRYSIKEFPVDIFDYDPVTINKELNAIPTDGKGFHFTGYGVTDCDSNSGINNSSAGFAKQGILANQLVNGLPDINYIGKTSNNLDGGIESGKVLFSTSEYTSAKTIYNDIPFEFIFDNQTGFYVYKSSANHAQLNTTTNKVELYADTLSTQNSYVWTADLSTAEGANDLTNPVASTNSYRATAINTDSTTRLDPYVAFPVSDIAAANVDQIYVRAKVPASVGTNKFQLFFDNGKGFHEARSFGSIQTEYYNPIPYTANGDWVEFVIDTSENPTNWTGTINAIRIDLFDDNKGALDRNGSYAFEIAQVSFIQELDDYATRGGYYPFSDIRNSYPGNNTNFTIKHWEELMLDADNVTDRASRSINNPSPAAASDMYPQLAYGTVMEFDFYIPVDKTGADLTYFFDGDDDLWVFVDGKLALDIGGGHGAITGSLNFTNGDVSVKSAQQVTGYNEGVSGDTGTLSTGKMDESQYSPGKHTMKVFYLERGGSVSNCFMKFNLPQTPTGSVNVSKNVVEKNGASMEALKNERFEFIIEMQNNGTGDDFKVKAPLANRAFYIINEDDTTETSSTDANGKFYLKDGQKAVFEISENYNVTVTESAKEIAGYEFVSTTYNGSNANAGTQLTVKKQEKSFAFVNTYDEQEVTLKYVPVNPTGCPEGKLGTVELTGDATSKTSATAGVSETIGMRMGEPVGSTATGNEVLKFIGWYSDPECENLISADAAFMPTKVAGSDLWAEATYYAKFEYKFGDLKVIKTGIQDVDHDGKLATAEEKQSSLFRVTGTSYSGQAIDMTVVIVGTDFTTIRDLPVGVYTVTEITDWSWRYAPNPASYEVVVTENGSTVTFTNSRQKTLWLSGDNWIQNLLSMNAIS